MVVKKMYKIIVIMLTLLLFSSGLSVNAINNDSYFKQDHVKSENYGDDEYKASGSDGVYDLLIIAPQKFSKYIQALVEHKNKFGVKTILVDVEDVYEQMYWHGRDDAEKVKFFIKKSIEEWGIKYVILFGCRKNQRAPETWWIPVRYSHLDSL